MVSWALVKRKEISYYLVVSTLMKESFQIGLQHARRFWEFKSLLRLSDFFLHYNKTLFVIAKSRAVENHNEASLTLQCNKRQGKILCFNDNGA